MSILTRMTAIGKGMNSKVHFIMLVAQTFAEKTYKGQLLLHIWQSIQSITKIQH